MPTWRALFAILLFCGCALTTAPGFGAGPDQLSVMIDPLLRPQQATIQEAGTALEVAASRDDQGKQTDFLAGHVRLSPHSEIELNRFLAAYGGRVVGSDAVPEAAFRALGAEAPEGGLKATTYTVSVDLSRADLADLPQRARAVGVPSSLRFSSEAGLRTFALLLDAQKAGYEVKPDFVLYPQQMGFRPGASPTFPQSLFGSLEAGALKAGAYDAFTERRYGADGDLARSNVIPAWQFLAAHGITRRVRLAVIDGGFWVNLPDSPPGPIIDSDIPATVWQWDRVENDANVNNENSMKCSGGATCPYHGTGVAGVAAGIANNSLGRMGVGSLVADLMLLRIGSSTSDRDGALRQVVGSGADVVVMSLGSTCNAFCSVFREGNAFSDLVKAGSRSVLIASAGNDGVQVETPPLSGGLFASEVTIRPCTDAYVICVGAIADNAVTRANFGNGLSSNYGARVDVFAPHNIPTMSYPDQGGPVSTPNPLFRGTSASAPFVAGVAAMLKAVNPNLGATEVGEIIRATARPGTVPDVTRTIDALAAVRRAAQGVPMVSDRFDGPGVVDFGTAATRTERDLNLDAHDSDVFRFSSTQAADAHITLSYPKDLAPVQASLCDEDQNCRPSKLTASTIPPPPAGAVANAYRQERTYTYRIAAGAHRIVARADDINSYELTLSVTPASVPPDRFENNDDFGHPTFFGLTRFGWIERGAEATIHTGPTSDVDVYLVRGVAGANRSTSGFGYALDVFPGVQIADFESSTTVEVYQQKPDGTPDLASKITETADGCSTNSLTVALEDGQDYFVVVKGVPGRYSIYNGGIMSFRLVNYINLEHFPEKPGPIEIEDIKYFVIDVDPAVTGIINAAGSFHISLIDPATGGRFREAQQASTGERLDLRGLESSRVLILEVQRLNGLTGTANTAQFEPRLELAPIARSSANLVTGGDADVAGAKGANLAPWHAAGDGSAALLAAAELPDAIAQESGRYVFGQGRGPKTGLQQTVRFGRDWLEAIRSGRTKANLAVRLGGEGKRGGVAQSHLTFLAEDGRELGSPAALSIGARERDGRPELIDVSTERVIPRDAVAARIDLIFRDGEAGDRSMADNVRLTLLEFVG